MDTTEFDAAYRGLLTAAESIGDTLPLAPDKRSAIDWTLGHIALSDRVLAAAARDVRTGISPMVDNREAVDGTALRLVGRDGQTVPDQRMSWRDLVRLRTTEHIPGHTAKLTAIASAKRSSPPGFSRFEKSGRSDPSIQSLRPETGVPGQRPILHKGQ